MERISTLTVDELKKENNYKKIELDETKDPIIRERTKRSAKTRNDNRKTELQLLSSLLAEKAEWITEKAELEFEIGDYRQANEGLAQTIKDMNDLHFEWRERIENKHKKKIFELNFLVRNLRMEIRRLEHELGIQ